MFEYTDPSLQGEVNSNMNPGELELKLYEAHLADKFSKAELARLNKVYQVKFQPQFLERANNTTVSVTVLKMLL